MTAEAGALPTVSPRRRVLQIALFVEMALSPVVAGIALLLPVVEQWEGYGYIPAIVWLALFVQCMFTFRWRGLWFLLGPPVAVVAIEAFLVAAPPTPQRATPAVSPVQQ